MHRCYPQYLSVKAHAKLSRPNAFDGLQIHTDELQEVIRRMAAGTLSHAVVCLAEWANAQLRPLTDPDGRSWIAWIGSTRKVSKPPRKYAPSIEP